MPNSCGFDGVDGWQVPKVISEEGACRVYDGDGGCGHPVCYEAMQWCIKTAKERSDAAVNTCMQHGSQ